MSAPVAPDDHFELLKRSSDEIIKYLYENPTSDVAVDTYSALADEEGTAHEQVEKGDLLAYAFNHDKTDVLEEMIEAGLKITADHGWMFAINYADYEKWQIVAEMAGLKPTCIIGHYDFEEVPFAFYEAMVNDLGPEEVLRAWREDEHNFHSNVESVVNQILNARDRAKAKAETGLPCPTIKVRGINMSHH